MNYLIATAGRAGSSLLNSYLQQLNIGYPQAWLDPNFYDKPYTLEDIKKALENKARKKGILGVKISWWYIFETKKVTGLRFTELINECFPNPKFIYLTRRNKVQQALSRVKHVMLSQSHVRNEEQEKEYNSRESKLKTIDVPIDDIKGHLLSNLKGHIAWEQFFHRTETDVFRLDFEDFVADKRGTVENIINYLELPIPKDFHIEDEYKPTHSEINDTWHDKLLARELRII